MGSRVWMVVEAAWRVADNKLRAEQISPSCPSFYRLRRAEALSILAGNPNVYRVDLLVPSPWVGAEIRAWLKQREADFEFVRDATQVYLFVDHQMAIEFKLRWYKQ